MEYPDLKSGSELKTITLKVGSKTLRLIQHESPDIITLYIGGHTKYCIYGFITKSSSPMARFSDISIGNLSKIHYNQACSLEHDFKRGVDTNMILKVFLSYIHKHYPHIKQMKFEDASYRPCDDGQIIDLAEMSYITTGKTWYEKNFAATLAPTSEGQFKVLELKFQKMKLEIDWNTFKGFITTKLPIDEIELQKIYEDATTWQDFFGPLREKMGIELFCPFVAPWLHTFMEMVFKFSFIQFKYLMPVEPNRISFTELPYSRGGRRFTRKNLKLRPLSLME